MAIGTKTLVDTVNLAISNLEITDEKTKFLQLSSVYKDFDSGFVSSVANLAALPAAADNRGRMVYVEDRCTYRISDGISWTDDFTSVSQGLQVWAWGSNSFGGRLGDNTTTDRSSPVSVVGGFTDWCGVSAGVCHSLGIRVNGTVWAWGLNSFGALGDNTTTDRSSPVSVVGGFTDWCDVSAGSHSLGIRVNGTVWAWGLNTSGQLGDGTTTNQSSPVLVAGGFTDWCAVAGGSGHSLGIRTNGTAWAWGGGADGRLGDGIATARSSPVLVAGGFTDWCGVSAGGAHSLGIRTNGTVWAWGFNSAGQLGDGTLTGRSSPVSVVGSFTDWCAVAGGVNHSLGIRTNGTAWAWGSNSQGRLGDGTTTGRSSPVSVVGGFTDWCDVSASGYHSIGIRTNGTAWAWGRGTNGQLGDGTTACRSSPVSVVGGFTDWCDVSAGREHSLAIRSTKGF
jgi:alpha-tubulin suppressor-like RCC1 family protein